MPDLSLGIDLGTSGLRSAVIDERGRAVSSASAGYGSDPDQNAESWWDGLCECLHVQLEALREAGIDAFHIGRICVDGTSGSMVLTNEALDPITPALMYNSAGFEHEAARIAEIAPARHITQGTNSALARAMRLQELDRKNEARHLLHQADFILARLRGIGGASDENNTLKLGYDPATKSWPDWFAALGLRLSLLPQVVAAGQQIGTISEAIAEKFGLSKRAKIHAGTTDSIAAFVASARLETGAAVTSLGTTLAIKLLSPIRIDAPEMGIYSHRLGPHWLVGGASNSGGGVLLDHFSPAELDLLSEQIDPEIASPLDYYPLRKPGERFPINDPELAPRMHPRPKDDAEFLHGLLEGIARIEAEGYRRLATLGAPEPQLVLTAGGGAKNDIWRQIRARVLGTPVAAADASEAAIGAAKLALLSQE